jgi:hypothetical protein
MKKSTVFAVTLFLTAIFSVANAKMRNLNAQPLPPGMRALNPQPLPPGMKAQLNPQPLPPRSATVNPQPLPPGEAKKTAK